MVPRSSSARPAGWLATPLLAVLVVVETTDIMFALDSIPAVFAVTTDPFIVFSSNLFAILGLRSLYFLLAGLLDRFIYLKTGLAALLVFAGAKILVGVRLSRSRSRCRSAVIVVILGTAIGASLVATHPRKEETVMPLVRIISGTALGLGALALFAGASAFRDGQPLLLELEVLLLGVVALAVLVAGAVLHLRQDGRPMARMLIVARVGSARGGRVPAHRGLTAPAGGPRARPRRCATGGSKPRWATRLLDHGPWSPILAASGRR